MKQFILKNKNLLMGTGAALVIGIVTMSFQDSPFVQQKLGAQEMYMDTTKPKKKVNQAELDRAMKELQLTLQQLTEEIKHIDLSHITAEVNNAMKEIDVQKIVDEALKEVDVKKIMEEVNSSLKEIDGKKIAAEVNEALKEVDINKEVQQALKEIDREKINAEIEASMKDLKLELKHFDKDQIKKELEKVKKELERTREELKKVKKTASV